MAKKWKDLMDKLPADRQARIRAKTDELIRDMPLSELREARQLTQSQLAKALGVEQAAVSRMEHRCDMYISTLQTAIKAMGGDLEITAVFPDGRIRIDQFRDIERSERKAARRRSA